MIEPVTPTGPPSGAQRRTTVVLGIVVTVLVAATALFLTLFLVERAAVADANTQVTNTEGEIAGQKDKLSDAKTAADDAEQRGQELQTTNDQMQACADASKAAITAAQSGTDQQLSDAIDKMLLDCVRQEGASGS